MKTMSLSKRTPFLVAVVASGFLIVAFMKGMRQDTVEPVRVSVKHRAPLVGVVVGGVLIVGAQAATHVGVSDPPSSLPLGHRPPGQFNTANAFKLPKRAPPPPAGPVLLSLNKPVFSSARGNLADPNTITKQIAKRDWIKDRFQFAKDMRFV